MCFISYIKKNMKTKIEITAFFLKKNINID